MRSKVRGACALAVALVVSAALASGCGGDDDSGGTSTGGAGGSTGGAGGSGGGGTGGSGGSSTGGAGGACPAAPDPQATDACDTCQDDTHMGCACDAETTACAEDADCDAIWDCTTGATDAGPGCDSLDADGAACVNKCLDAHPAGKAKYLAMEKCGYCKYCAAACDTAEYCGVLGNPSDGGTTDGGSDSGKDATTDASGDASTD
ncbi:MAG: hypothetical protein IT375_29145 [Polyangiaceae bacterium]|nr:hypothetical protein [Polyangiaceae bacterium]